MTNRVFDKRLDLQRELLFAYRQRAVNTPFDF